MFSGFLKCADCGRALHRKSSKNINYFYCRISKQSERTCQPRSIREDILTKVVLRSIQSQISLVEDLAQIIDRINRAPVTMRHSERLELALQKHMQEREKLIGISDSMYTDFKSGVISKEEYLRIKNDYANKLQKLQSTIEKIESERQLMSQGITSENSYFKDFQKHRNIESLTREMLVGLVDIISVHKDGSVEIQFNFQDQYMRVLEFIQSNEDVAAG